jgi:hypothetical protein
MGHRARRFYLLSGLSAGAVIALLCAPPALRAAVINVVDVIPNSDSSEAFQNSEPSLGVDPLNPSQMIAGSFGNGTPYFKSINGGTLWSDYGTLSTNDKSIAWRQDGVAALTATLQGLSPLTTQIQTFSGTIAASNFGAPINTFNPGQFLDQPWIRTGPSGQTYEAYNHLGNTGGRTASIRVSSDNGTTFASPITLETVNPAAGQDAPSVRQAVNGSTVYAAFTRWGAPSGVTGGTIFPGSQVVVVKSTNSGASFSAGVSAASTTGYFANASNTPLTLGQQRTSSDLAIAVDPNNASHVVIAYGNVPGSGQLQLNVIESTDGGATWSAPKFTTPLGVRSALPGISILANGDIGLLYASYNPATNALSQHLLTTTDDFASTSDSLLGMESNATPTIQFHPYLGDFYDLTSVGDMLYGIFSSSNADNGILASYPDATFQRDFTGTEGTGSFQLTNLTGAPVAFSIDPFFFSVDLAAVPEPATLTLLGTSLLGLAALRRGRRTLTQCYRLTGRQGRDV